MIWWACVMITWVILSGGLVVWFSKAAAAVKGSEWPKVERTTCATCRHDELTHQHYGPGTDCSQCPCPAFRPPG